jgi:hypothetical protein
MPERVEDYKIDPELREFVKKYEKLAKLGDQLQIQLADKADRLKTMSDILYGVEKRKEAMLRMVPNGGQRRLPEQKEPNPNLAIQY